MPLHLVKRLQSKLRKLNAMHQWRRYSKYQVCYDITLSFSQAVAKFNDPNGLHAYMHHHFVNLSPEEVREHRRYFSQEGRGFGEDAFHAMWWLMLEEFRPRYCLEIGVFRGQVISLWGVIAKKTGMSCDIHGISPFSAAGDTVSSYLTEHDYMSDTLNAFETFGLPQPSLVRALSTDAVGIGHILSRQWDLIYIDGNHDYEVAKADYLNCVAALRPGGLLVMDDSSLGTSFVPPSFSFAGHPGPSRVVAELAKNELEFLGAIGHNNVFKKPLDELCKMGT